MLQRTKILFLLIIFCTIYLQPGFSILSRLSVHLSQTSENLMAELFSAVSLATSITSEGSAPVFPNSMLLLSTRMRSSGPIVEAGTAGTGSGMKTSCTVSGNVRGWTAGSWGGGGEAGSTLVPHVFFGTALLTRIGTRLCSLWQD